MGKITTRIADQLPDSLKNQRFIFANVRFGTPSRNCSGVGICKVDLLDVNAPVETGRQACSSSLAILAPSAQQKLVTIYFYSPSIKPCAAKQLFLKGCATLLERVKLPKNEVLSLMGAHQFLSEGCYPVAYEGHWLKVEVALSKHPTHQKGRFAAKGMPCQVASSGV